MLVARMHCCFPMVRYHSPSVTVQCRRTMENQMKTIQHVKEFTKALNYFVGGFRMLYWRLTSKVSH